MLVGVVGAPARFRQDRFAVSSGRGRRVTEVEGGGGRFATNDAPVAWSSSQNKRSEERPEGLSTCILTVGLGLVLR